MLSLGSLIVIDLRMLGVAFAGVPATTVSNRLFKPMMVGFVIMFITGITLFYGIPVRTTQSIWFRIKMVLLVIAFINALTFHRYMQKSVNTWDTAPTPPARARMAAAVSLSVWAAIVVCGRFIAYDWFDCNQTGNSALMNTLAGCTAQ
jgi:multisubunit Na+/H+ antiporter MnhF subunit